MTVNEAIGAMAQDRFVERLLEKFGSRLPASDREDIAQMVYLSLLTSPAVPEVIARGKLQEYTQGLCYKMMNSQNAPFQRTYRNKRFTALTEFHIDTIPNERS